MNPLKLLLLGGGAYLLYRAWAGSQSAGAPAGQVPASNAAGSVTLVNQSGAPFKVGDQWTLTVMAGPGLPLVITASQNGQSVGTSTLGTTDANGRFVLSGSWSAANAGTWSEQITAGGQSLPPLNFTVGLAGLAAAPVPGRQFTVADLRSAVQRGGGQAVAAAARSRAGVVLPVPVVMVGGSHRRPPFPRNARVR